VAIASNGTGDLLVFMPDSSGGLNGRVQLWDHETGEVSPIALDFT
jgi:hypothetical protein